MLILMFVGYCVLLLVCLVSWCALMCLVVSRLVVG